MVVQTLHCFAGDTINLDASTTPAQTFVQLVIHLQLQMQKFLGNGAKVKVIATLTRTIASEKTKTNQPGHLVLVDADASAGAEYGTASQHKEISLGRADVINSMQCLIEKMQVQIQFFHSLLLLVYLVLSKRVKQSLVQ